MLSEVICICTCGMYLRTNRKGHLIGVSSDLNVVTVASSGVLNYPRGANCGCRWSSTGPVIKNARLAIAWSCCWAKVGKNSGNPRVSASAFPSHVFWKVGEMEGWREGGRRDGPEYLGLLNGSQALSKARRLQLVIRSVIKIVAR